MVPAILHDPFFWGILSLLAALVLLVHQELAGYTFSLEQVFDDHMHHEDLVLWLLAFSIYCIAKIVRGLLG